MSGLQGTYILILSTVDIPKFDYNYFSWEAIHPAGGLIMTEIIGGVLGAFGLSASAGLNAYIPLLVVSLLAKFTNLIELAEPWSALESWWVIGVLAVLGTRICCR